MKRLSIFVHYDKDDIVDDYVYLYLSALAEISSVIFVSTAKLNDEDLSRLESTCQEVIQRDNVGYDFLSYKVGLVQADLNLFDEVIICNDSSYGPFYSFDEIFNKMSNVDCDFWGITKSQQYTTHLQSYFIVFKKQVVQSLAFKEFWENVIRVDSKKNIIHNYEIGLSQVLIKAGFKLDSYVKFNESRFEIIYKFFKIALFGKYKKARSGYKSCVIKKKVASNPTLLFWDELILNHNMPFLKSSVLKDNAFGDIKVKDYRKVINSISSYPCEVIEKHLSRMKNGPLT